MFWKIFTDNNTSRIIRVSTGNVDVFVIEITEHRRVPPEPYGHVLREYPEQW